jgi:hypothetical protein
VQPIPPPFTGEVAAKPTEGVLAAGEDSRLTVQTARSSSSIGSLWMLCAHASGRLGRVLEGFIYENGGYLIQYSLVPHVT